MAQTDLFRKAKSLFSTTLNTGIGTGTVDTITPNSVTGLPTDTETTLTFDRVDSAGTATPTKMERITGTISGGNLTSYTRGVDGSTEQAHSAGAVIEYIWSADDLNDMVDGILEEHNQSGGHKDLTASTVVVNNSVAASTMAASQITASAVVGQGNAQLLYTNPAYMAFDAYTPAGAGTATLNLALGNDHRITMPASGNITIALSNEKVGQRFLVSITQTAGSQTVTWFSTIKWAGGSAPTLTTTAGKRDTFGFIVTAAGTYDAFIVGQNL